MYIFAFQSFDDERTWWRLFPKRVDIWVFNTCLFIIYVDLFHDKMHYTIREVLTHKPISTPPSVIKVPVSSHESEQLCVRVLNVPIMPLHTVFFSVGYLELFLEHVFFTLYYIMYWTYTSQVRLSNDCYYNLSSNIFFERRKWKLLR